MLIGAGKGLTHSAVGLYVVGAEGTGGLLRAIAAKNARLCWASLHYGDDFGRTQSTKARSCINHLTCTSLMIKG